MKHKTNKITPQMAKLSLYLMATLLTGYVYLIFVSRNAFSAQTLYGLILLGIIGLGLIVKGIYYHSKQQKPKNRAISNSTSAIEH